eukprot:TRINITY_DN3293_c0_g1_i1.p1 TRINITY_DN3293_c0_g1~~TRINITY_DN3293_c0_g1_i1.p1  ORF type:complete len:1890 (+),score=667.66 TRINITY_DN3293_c0_g1_i1:65-5734(+)
MPGDNTWTTNIEETRETNEMNIRDDPSLNEAGLDHFLNEMCDGATQKSGRSSRADAMEDTAVPTRIAKISRMVAKQQKVKAAPVAIARPVVNRKRKLDSNKQPTDEGAKIASKADKEKKEELARRKEVAIMRGGRYYKMKDEAHERDKAMRDAKRNKMDGREYVDRAMKAEDNSTLERRANVIKDLARRFYSHEVSHVGNVAIGEISTLVPQHNLGYIELLGEEGMLPKVLEKDKDFMKSRKILFDGISILHQSFVVGDVVKFEFSRLYEGTDVTKARYRQGPVQSRWIATNLEHVRPAKEAIPFKCRIVPQEVRKYMLALLYLIEAGADLSLYVKIAQELEMWGRILGEPFTDKPSGGLMQWHVLLILSIASRSWLEDCNMKILLWSFFNSFTGTTFLKETLPLHIPSLGPSVLVQVARFVYLYKKHTCENIDILRNLLIAAKPRVLKDKVIGAEFIAMLEKLDTVLHDTESFVTLLSKAAAKGYNALMIKDKSELMNIEDKIIVESQGHSFETDGFNPLPTLDEFADESSLDPDRLPKNRAEGSWGTPETYTKASFTLLRADTYKEFQYSMHHKIYKWPQFAESDDASHKREVGNPSTWCRLVGILGVNYVGSVTQAGRLCYTVRFRLFEPMQEAWKMRMMGLGNLIAMTVDRFNRTVWWGVVAHRDQILLNEGIIGVEFIAGDPHELQKQLQALQLAASDQECWLVEARSIFFSGYRPVLEALQQFGRMSVKTGHCPFEDYLVYGRDKPCIPPWVKHNEAAFIQELTNCVSENTFDPSQERAIAGLRNAFLLVQGPPGTGKSYTGVKMVDVILRTRYAARDKMERNPEKKRIEYLLATAKASSKEYQSHQIEVEKLKDEIIKLKIERDNATETKKKMLLRETITSMYKTREGLKGEMQLIDTKQSEIFAEILRLEQKKERDMEELAKDTGPIQIITYKNHSLDEFLMDVKPSLRDDRQDPGKKEGLVRFGSRSQCEELMQYNVNELVKRFEMEPNLMSYSKLMYTCLRNKVEHLKNLGAEISHLDGGNLTTECMTCNMTEAQAANFGEVTDAKIEAWIGVPAVEVLVSLEDVAKAATADDLDREGSDLEEEDDGMPKGLNLQAQRDIYQTKQEQENEDRSRVRFMASFSSVLPDRPLPKVNPISFDPDEYDNLADLTLHQRQELRDVWRNKHLRSVILQYQKLKTEYIYLVASQQEFREQIKVDALQHSQVIGLTTTGCTINKELLNKVKPTILIVEEAAEILESQILSCLNQLSIQQVVLIGDHKQLRPIVNNYSIARDCRLDLSLFERMANNGIPVHNLTNQRRMVKQISQFVRPLYRQLIDDPCLEPRKLQCDGSGEIRDAGNIPGLGKPVWFWSHDTPEERSNIGLSVVNPTEVRMVVWLVKYFTARGLSLNQITVLTPYKGQLRELRDSLELADAHRKDMVCTVDRFQGDENDLMIVSLVRTQSLTEFIKAPDRMCVLLSRARFGMVILGSSQLLDSDEVPHWQLTMSTLSSNSWIGSYFPLRCDRHPQETQRLHVNDLLRNDNAEYKIDGFCQQLCKASFKECKKPELHRCKRSCHSGEHLVCDARCGTVLECQHICKQECGECYRNGCMCTDTVSAESIDCGVFMRNASGAFVWTPHIQTKEGCMSEFKPCKRVVFKKRTCGHFAKTQCNVAFNPSRRGCRSCANGVPVPDVGVDTLSYDPEQGEPVTEYDVRETVVEPEPEPAPEPEVVDVDAMDLQQFTFAVPPKQEPKEEEEEEPASPASPATYTSVASPASPASPASHVSAFATKDEEEEEAASPSPVFPRQSEGIVMLQPPPEPAKKRKKKKKKKKAKGGAQPPSIYPCTPYVPYVNPYVQQKMADTFWVEFVKEWDCAERAVRQYDVYRESAARALPYPSVPL